MLECKQHRNMAFCGLLVIPLLTPSLAHMSPPWLPRRGVHDAEFKRELRELQAKCERFEGERRELHSQQGLGLGLLRPLVPAAQNPSTDHFTKLAGCVSRSAPLHTALVALVRCPGPPVAPAGAMHTLAPGTHTNRSL